MYLKRIFLLLALSSSHHGFATEYSYMWQFGDGQSSTEKEPQYQYKQPGFYTVQLEVFANQNLSYSKTHEVDAVTPFVKMLNIASSNNIMLNKPTTLSAELQSVKPLALDYQWNMPDGSAKKGKKITYTFTQAGDQKVKLIGSFENREIISQEVSFNVKASDKDGDRVDDDGSGGSLFWQLPLLALLFLRRRFVFNLSCG
ncbi:PKD domain-containing protein [Pseudoalteromonas sp. CO348]|uniref:PKD domain-containing protein n=1 Tax=Pseudoalteromonas sp. CO348 TaxID=1777271 RepID=UPI001023EBC2|nr:PKD domain-containing protein [Pseudoalteromonas sp. CO348]RZG08322.1 PKD domain-containing protein [Pseudoalteromonas sp. CO348]